MAEALSGAREGYGHVHTRFSLDIFTPMYLGIKASMKKETSKCMYGRLVVW